ncbi:rRNA maturation RNase YbeY [Alkalicoccus chagannorensis]|uniref:rRNA maturation RNase YbeY n=1 Tax=Alkalicoccus chagannorensis TaxID=427072 RepID=UPI00040C878B|nr:rRNA maturation RNase YbeY [Alkalicoccus chagannorensis]
MTYSIDVIDENEKLTEEEAALLHGVLTEAMTRESLPEDSEVCVRITSDADIHELNRTYRNKDKPTDVLSFAMQEGEEMPHIEGMPLVLGDIVISYDTAVRQAETYGHSRQRELAFLAVHGLLHLHGYDHESSEAENDMFAQQEAVLAAYGIEK